MSRQENDLATLPFGNMPEHRGNMQGVGLLRPARLLKTVGHPKQAFCRNQCQVTPAPEHRGAGPGSMKSAPGEPAGSRFLARPNSTPPYWPYTGL